jgi:hypothetical protein
MDAREGQSAKGTMVRLNCRVTKHATMFMLQNTQLYADIKIVKT